ncbi:MULTISPECIES: hypothetical protein [Streptomyces]|uniref:Transposase n=1 Tax=Streptomyces ramulosus TaxID=47762 RepID=A0ABW1FHY7_9ACTN
MRLRQYTQALTLHPQQRLIREKRHDHQCADTPGKPPPRTQHVS